MGLSTASDTGLRIGLTGGIGSGKSTVSAIWVALGATLIDTDAIARQLTAPGGAALAAITARFGAAAIDVAGAMDRDYMRRLAFSDPHSRLALEAILHPMIGAEAARLSAARPDSVTVFDVPLLVESGRWRSRVDKVLVVDCSESTQIERVVRRSAWTVESVQAVMLRQASRRARLACADAVIYNEQLNPVQLREQVHALFAHWVGTAPGTISSATHARPAATVKQ